jgi:hypothetical protein
MGLLFEIHKCLFCTLPVLIQLQLMSPLVLHKILFVHGKNVFNHRTYN